MRPLTRRTVLATSGALTLAAGGLATPASAAPAPAPAPAPPSAPGPDGKALRAAIHGLPDQYATAALVRIGGRNGCWHGSSGVRDLVSGRAADPDARFRAGSTTKVVTAATVLHLAAEGRIDLDEPVQHYLPGLLGSLFTLPIAVRRLLNHTSGIPAGDGFTDPYAHRFDTLPPERLVESAAAKGPEFAPGDRQHYLNINYTILGMLIEQVTGDSYAMAATRRVLRPAGMRNSYFPGTDPRIHGPHHRGYQVMARPDGSTRLVDVTEWNQADRWAAGDMISTTADLERLITALVRGRIVPRPQLHEMFTGPANLPEDEAPYSAGLQRHVVGEREFWFKSGARYGYATAVAADLELDRTLVYSVNATDAKDESMNPVAARIVQAALR
ncbi:serine hydrolase domain-containing protein [Streptomyces sp. NPDC089424]|uniref:serine hydrolase domain-containing protein n=1 Tax=Streptomyces sp. NPDC089424 TaxID=3365917 RepID=UPI00381913E2